MLVFIGERNREKQYTCMHVQGIKHYVKHVGYSVSLPAVIF